MYNTNISNEKLPQQHQTLYDIQKQKLDIFKLHKISGYPIISLFIAGFY